MKTELWYIGKTSFDYLETGINLYTQRIKKYIPFEVQLIPDVKNAKNLSKQEIKNREGALIIKKIEKGTLLILLDENGKQFNSINFAKDVEKMLQLSHKKIVFLIGGAYGFSKEVYTRADRKISLSNMTFSHQMVRLFFVEQFYRAQTILKNEPYHHQ